MNGVAAKDFNCVTDGRLSLPFWEGWHSLLTTDRPMRTRTDEEIDVDFEVECDDFAVPEWPGLRCSATFRVCGIVTIDHSGDSVTPDGPEVAYVQLFEATSHTIHLYDKLKGIDEPLPEWLEYLLVTTQQCEFDAAFLAAVGGMEKLEDLACEEAAK
jgi:hypothetical protein